MKSKSKKGLWLMALVAIFPYFLASLSAQVTIGKDTVPNSKAVLELRSGAEYNSSVTDAKGLLLPRVSVADNSDLAQFGTAPIPEGLLVYNTNTSSPSGTFPKGLFYWDGTTWESASTPLWFYMPSMPINAEYTDGIQVLEVNLYANFDNQFFPNTPSVRNPGYTSNLARELRHLGATDYNYLVTGYDTTVFDIVELTNDGILRYKVRQPATDATYLNVVFVLK
jgi:hypothetical protein